jgi:hypothetical protein
MTKIAQKKVKSNKEYAQSAQIIRTDHAENVRISPFLLDTSAQLCTDPYKKSLESLTKRARAKFITNGLLLPLIDLHSSLEKSYWRTWHCTSQILQDGQKLTSKYCNNRCCIVCARIRTAKMIERYFPVIKSEIEDPQFVTLTFPSVQDRKLKAVVNDMILNFQRIKNKMRMRDQVKLKGFRKIEVTYNPIEGFHPHIHSINDGVRPSEILLDQWLKHYPKANYGAQNIEPADDGSILELLKYVTKLVDKKDYTRKDGKIQVGIHAKSLDTIFRALYGRRVYQGYGIHLNLNEDIDELKSEVYEEILSGIDTWTWDQDQSDWISTYGELLTGCDAHQIYQVIKKYSGC